MAKVLVGTGRFELNSEPANPSQTVFCALLRNALPLGCSLVGSKRAESWRLKLDGEVLVGTGRFELPTPRTPSECSTRLSHVPTGWKPLRQYGTAVGLTLEFYTTAGSRRQG